MACALSGPNLAVYNLAAINWAFFLIIGLTTLRMRFTVEKLKIKKVSDELSETFDNMLENY